MAGPPRGAHWGSGGTRSTGQTGLNRTAPLTPDPDRVTVVVEAEVDGGNVLTTATDVVVARVDRTVTTDPAATVELGPGSREDVVVAVLAGSEADGRRSGSARLGSAFSSRFDRGDLGQQVIPEGNGPARRKVLQASVHIVSCQGRPVADQAHDVCK